MRIAVKIDCHILFALQGLGLVPDVCFKVVTSQRVEQCTSVNLACLGELTFHPKEGPS